MKTFKFLLPGGVGPFSGFRWPVPSNGEPAAWVQAADGEARRCSAGIHACAVDDLPFWLQDELWEIELEGVPTRGRRKLVAARGRLVRRIDEWNEVARHDFVEDCIERLRRLAARHPSSAGYLADAEAHAHHAGPAPVAYISARAAELAAGARAYDAERAAQARWLADRLGLDYSA